MSDQPKRRFWQIHLSTALVLMFTASGLLWLNLRQSETKRVTVSQPSSFSRGGTVVQHDTIVEQGWPFDFRARVRTVPAVAVPASFGRGSTIVIEADSESGNAYLAKSVLILNVVVCGGLLIVLMVLYEWRTRAAQRVPLT